MKKNYSIRCSVCGRFIGQKEIDQSKIEIKFIPETEFTKEETIFTHRSCLRAEFNVKK